MVELQITLREGGEEREEKIKLGGDGQPVTMEQILTRLYKYQVKRKVEVVDMRARVIKVEEYSFTLDDDGDFLMNGEPVDESLILGEGSSAEMPPPAPVKVAPKPAKVVPPPQEESTDEEYAAPPAPGPVSVPMPGIMHGLTDEQKALLAEEEQRRALAAQRDPYAKQGLIMATPQDIQMYAPESAEQAFMGQLGGGRKVKQIPEGSPIAVYAGEYYLFEPFPNERQRGITTIAYPRVPVFFKYQPPYRPNEYKMLMPKHTGVRGLSFASKGGDRQWEVTDGRKVYSVPEMHLISAPSGPGLEDELFDQLDYAPDTKQTYSKDQFAAMMKAQQGGGAGAGGNMRVDLEVLDAEPQDKIHRPTGPSTAKDIQMTLEQKAIAQAEAMDPSKRKGQRPGIILTS